MNEKLHYLELDEVAKMIENREISSTELTAHYLSRISEFEAQLNAFNLVTDSLARQQADKADREISKGMYRGPLHGVPIAVKDIFDIEGLPTTASMAIHQNTIARQDATVISKLQDAGAVILGKTNLTEGVYGEHVPPFGSPVNPWNADYWPGASSSGSGVAVASGLCAAALGSETGGSIRLPSAANGTVGIKPTWGRVSRHGVFELAASLDHVGPMARSARDAALLLGAIAGADANDPTASLMAVPSYAAALELNASEVTIGLDKAWLDDTVDAETLAAFNAATRELLTAGCTAKEISVPDVSEMIWDWFPICAAQTALAHAETFPARRAEYGPALASLLDQGIALSATEYQKFLLKREDFAGRFNALFTQVDVIALPVLSFPSPSMERMSNLDDDLIAGIHQFTCPFNLSRHPSIVLRCGTTPHNMPIVFQLIGKHFDEQTLIALGHLYQSRTEWHRIHPVI